MKVQMKSHGWHDVEVNGNLITGDTYVCKDMIKKYLGGKWDSEKRGWIVDPELLKKHTGPQGNIMVG